MRKVVQIWAHILPCFLYNTPISGRDFTKSNSKNLEENVNQKSEVKNMSTECKCPNKDNNVNNKNLNSTICSDSNACNCNIDEQKKNNIAQENYKKESTQVFSDPAMNVKLFTGNDVLNMLNKYEKYIINNYKENSTDQIDLEQFMFKYAIELVLDNYFSTYKKGLIINIEGVDGTGKNTQSIMLSQLLTSLGYENEVFHFPSYDKENPDFTGTLCNMMLEGKLGNINAVTPVSNTMFFIVDQIGQWHLKIKKAYEEGKIIILDRFYYSNLFHHMTKLTGLQSEEFKKWFDLTIKLSGLPYPDLTVYMSLSPEVAFARMEQRQNNDSTHKSDIHEDNKEYLRNCIIRGLDIANNLHSELGNAFRVINGEQNPNHIHCDIIEALIDALGTMR